MMKSFEPIELFHSIIYHTKVFSAYYAMAHSGILLEPNNRIIYDTCVQKMKTENRDPIEVKLCDFDEVTYKLFISPQEPNFLYLSLNVPSWGELQGTFHVMNRLKREFGSMVQQQAQTGYDFTLKIDLDKIPGDVDRLITKLSQLKTIVIGTPYYDTFSALRKGENKVQDPLTYNIRKDTVVYIFPGEDRVTLVHSIDFLEKSDKVVAKVFLQEFQEARRRVPQAPICTFSLTPPAQMSAFGMNPEEATGNFGWITFAVLKQHIQTEEKCVKAVNLLTDFRAYLQYHIKCSKAHFHQRMRARVVSLLHFLNRSQMTFKKDDKIKKTMSGRTFVRD